MKRTDLAKNLGLKINSKLKGAAVPGRFGALGDAGIERREKRKQDQAAGLVPFAVKIEKTLVEEIRARASKNQQSADETVAELLKKALSA